MPFAPTPVDEAERLPARTKLVFALGDHTTNLSLSALSLYYGFFLTTVAGLRPGLAGLVMLMGRTVDAFTDPAMGRISDLTSWQMGRRRPYFLIGMIPFGVSFGLLWSEVPLASQAGKFAFYAGIYVLYSIASTVLAVPYMALIPELTADYQERTSINTYRAALATLGTLLAAVGTKALAQHFGGGSTGYAWMGAALGVWLTLPWLAVHRVTWERPDFRPRRTRAGFFEGAASLLRHRAYRRLAGLYLFGRMAMDVVGAMFVFYFSYWILRPDDAGITLAVLLVTVVLSLPIWLRVSRRVDKRTLFILGTSWWVVFQCSLLFADASWPAAWLFAVAALVGVGYAVADLMPWAMLGDVIDEGELESGERREGTYAGFMTFLRKLGGAGGVALALFALELAGFLAGEATAQPESAVLAIRLVTALAPIALLVLAAGVATGYPLSRARHREILAALRARREEA